MKFYYQSELDNLDIETIKAVEDYTEQIIPDWLFYKLVEQFESIRDEAHKLNYLEETADDLDLVEFDFDLTPTQEVIIAYMFINDLFSKEYTDGVMQLLDNVLL